VIYHLNNRNEDFEFELQEMAERHESDMAALRSDAGAKLAAARAQLQDVLNESKVLISFCVCACVRLPGVCCVPTSPHPIQHNHHNTPEGDHNPPTPSTPTT
jgi:hypothetical protein